jgi:hypothetical protein
MTDLRFGLGSSSIAVAAFAARYVGLIDPTLTRGATCFHRFAVCKAIKITANAVVACSPTRQLNAVKIKKFIW